MSVGPNPKIGHNINLRGPEIINRKGKKNKQHKYLLFTWALLFFLFFKELSDTFREEIALW